MWNLAVYNGDHVTIIIFFFSFILNSLANFLFLFIGLVYFFGSLTSGGLSCNMAILSSSFHCLCILFFHFSFTINPSPYASSFVGKHVTFSLFTPFFIFVSWNTFSYLLPNFLFSHHHIRPLAISLQYSRSAFQKISLNLVCMQC